MSTPASSARRAGVLLHPTSLPGLEPFGTLGNEAYRFVDFLHAAGQTVWQVLPLVPTHSDRSPYSGLSAYAGNPELLSYSLLDRRGWLAEEAGQTPLERAWEGFHRCANQDERQAWELFQVEHGGWLDDYVLFILIRRQQGGTGWWQWPTPLRGRDEDTIDSLRRHHRHELTLLKFEQFLFYKQWQQLKAYANERGVLLFGDLPIFLAHDSADVWAAQDHFLLDDEGQPILVAGVPPDYFSATGQRWGNPLYDWERMTEENFAWWRARLTFQLEWFDLLRIDHFRGFDSCWAIPAGEKTAVNGHWEPVPGEMLFERLQQQLGELPLIAEDLGMITEEVVALRRRFGLPGMRVLQFAFEGDEDNPHRLGNITEDSVVYTGTHDNDTTLGWFAGLGAERRALVLAGLGKDDEAMPWPLIRAAYGSVARLAVVPMQDLLALGSGNRMNLPGTSEGNWGWRFSWEQLDSTLAERLLTMTSQAGRL